MISIYVVLSGLFATLAYISYNFARKSHIKTDDHDIRKEHRLYHLIFSVLLCISTTTLAVLYISAVVFSTLYTDLIDIVPALLIIKHGVMVVFVSTCLLFLKHVIDEDTPSHRLYIHRESDKYQRRASDQDHMTHHMARGLGHSSKSD